MSEALEKFEMDVKIKTVTIVMIDQQRTASCILYICDVLETATRKREMKETALKILETAHIIAL